MTRRSVPLHPCHPERTCWGCDRYCPADDLACGNGTIRAPHPVELFGDDWLEWAQSRPAGTSSEQTRADPVDRGTKTRRAADVEP